jgi:hypothetical protein
VTKKRGEVEDLRAQLAAYEAPEKPAGQDQSAALAEERVGVPGALEGERLRDDGLERAGLELVDRLERHVNRRTGRRAGEYFESVLVAYA